MLDFDGKKFDFFTKFVYNIYTKREKTPVICPCRPIGRDITLKTCKGTGFESHHGHQMASSYNGSIGDFESFGGSPILSLAANTYKNYLHCAGRPWMNMGSPMS